MLDWRNATFEDRVALRNFRCADPANATFNEDRGVEYHDAPWEFEVQEWICALNPPLSAPNFLFLGFDSDGLAAVIYLKVSPLDRYCYIPALAIAHRASGHGLAGEALDRVQNLMAKYDFNDDYLVDALVDQDNSAAKSSFSKNGYEFVELKGHFERWARIF